MSTGSIALIAVFSFIVATALWRDVTAKFLEENGENSEFVAPTFVLHIIWDFWRALAFKLGGQKKLPIGVYLHGAFAFLAYGLIILYAFREAAS